MSPDARRWLEAAMKLSDAERAELAIVLADSVGDPSTDEDIQAAWMEEAKRRLEDIRAGKSKTHPWEDVHRKLEAMVQRVQKRGLPTD